MVAVMNREFAQIPVGEFAATPSANPRVDLECPFAIAGFAGKAVARGVGDHAVGVGGLVVGHCSAPDEWDPVLEAAAVARPACRPAAHAFRWR